MCNIVTEFYLYSIVYIYLINSRSDVTYSVRHHLRIADNIRDSYTAITEAARNGHSLCVDYLLGGGTIENKWRNIALLKSTEKDM